MYSLYTRTYIQPGAVPIRAIPRTHPCSDNLPADITHFIQMLILHNRPLRTVLSRLQDLPVLYRILSVPPSISRLIFPIRHKEVAQNLSLTLCILTTIPPRVRRIGLFLDRWGPLVLIHNPKERLLKPRALRLDTQAQPHSDLLYPKYPATRKLRLQLQQIVQLFSEQTQDNPVRRVHRCNHRRRLTHKACQRQQHRYHRSLLFRKFFHFQRVGFAAETSAEPTL
jgi:hypothetical protein